MLRLIDRIDNAWATGERYFLMVLLLGMLALAFTQVVMRNLFSSGLEWADVTVRHLVLWVGLLGASIAAKEKRHLSIDIASRLVPPKWYHLVDAFLCLVTTTVCVLFLWASYKFTLFLYEWGTGTLEGLPALAAGLILPLAFASIALRFLIRGVHELAAFRNQLQKGTT